MITYRGRTVTEKDVAFIKALIAENPDDSRRALSKRLCLTWNWVQPNGTLRDMVCRGLMLELHRADCLASHGDLSHHRFCEEMLATLREEELRPPPLLRGRDLLAMGYAAGPLLGEILRAVEDAQASIEAARRARFTAGRQRDVPVEVWVTLPYGFVLN